MLYCMMWRGCAIHPELENVLDCPPMLIYTPCWWKLFLSIRYVISFQKYSIDRVAPSLHFLFHALVTPWIGERLGLSTERLGLSSYVDLYTLLMKTFPFHQMCNHFPKVINRSRSPVPALSLSRPIVRARPLYSARGRNSLATGL